MLLPKLKSAFSYEMGLLHLSGYSLQNLCARSGSLPDLSRPPSQNEGDNTKKYLRLARNAGDKELVYYSYSMCSKISLNATSKLAKV